MKQKQQIEIVEKPSQLERFNIGFEYNKTLREIKHEVHLRTMTQ
jgi:hypothetical protein